jgi:hypothetical protein
MSRLTLAAPAKLAGFAAALLIAAACTVAKSPATGTPPGATAHPPATPTAVTEAGDSAEDVLVLRTATGYEVVFGRTGESLFDLPNGAASADWRSVATATPDGATTNVQFVAGEGGGWQGEAVIPGQWRLPSVGHGGGPSGLSSDGRILVLEEAKASPARSRETRFAVVQAGGNAKVHVIKLEGSFAFDALSPDGQWLYLIERASTGQSYQVRRALVSTGRLDDGVIVDKRNVDEVMQGEAVTQRTGPDGWVYTLYRGADGAFVHALDTANGGAFCIDLPDTDNENDATTARWGLALEATGRSLYAANGETGQVYEIDLEDFEVARSGLIPRQVGAIELAKFENGEWASAGTAAVDPKGEILFVARDNGVAAVRTSDLSSLGTLDPAHAYRSVVVGGTGVVYGIDSQGALIRLGSMAKPSTQQIGGYGYSAVEAVVTVR